MHSTWDISVIGNSEYHSNFLLRNIAVKSRLGHPRRGVKHSWDMKNRLKPVVKVARSSRGLMEWRRQ